MTNIRFTHKLTGCAPIPLANYLKGLGILRLVAEQADPEAQGWWSGDIFYLRTKLDEGELCKFFLEDYQPTPLVGPWGARSGFFAGASEKSAREALNQIEQSELPRLIVFKEAIQAVREVLSKIGLANKADSPEEKRLLMMQCRAWLPDSILPWLDATYMLLDTETKYPPMLGTGGNEGSGSYMSGFAQQVAAVVIDRNWDHALHTSLFGTMESQIASTQTPGHFSPEAAGGANAGSMSEGNVATNPWDYLLLLEGALLFAAASVKKLEHREGGVLGYPFCVRQSGVGYGSASASDEDHQRPYEMWLPTWTLPSTVNELSALFSEGRAQVGQRSVRNGVDFARALAGLGSDRGISEFQRYGFQQRNGLSYFAVPLGRFKVQAQPQTELLLEPSLDAWLDSFRRAANSDTAPASAQRTLRLLESSILALCQQKGASQLQSVLVALGEAEIILATTSKLRTDSFQRPVPLLSPQWLLDCDDQTTEFRLAVSLAAMYSQVVGDFRQHLEAVEIKGQLSEGRSRWVEWSENSTAQSKVVWSSVSLEENIVAVLQRRSLEAVRSGEHAGDGTLVFPGESSFNASLADVYSFIASQTDDHRIEKLLVGLSLIDWGRVRHEGTVKQLHSVYEEEAPDATFAILKLCHSPYAICKNHVTLDPAIARLASVDRMNDATSLASRRLRGSGLVSAVGPLTQGGTSSRRIAAALLFPLSWTSLNILADLVLKPERQAT